MYNIKYVQYSDTRKQVNTSIMGINASLTFKPIRITQEIQAFRTLSLSQEGHTHIVFCFASYYNSTTKLQQWLMWYFTNPIKVDHLTKRNDLWLVIKHGTIGEI